MQCIYRGRPDLQEIYFQCSSARRDRRPQFIPAAPGSAFALRMSMSWCKKNYTRIKVVRFQRCSLQIERLFFSVKAACFLAGAASALCGTWFFHQSSCQCAADLGLLGGHLYRTMQLCRVRRRGGNEDVHQVQLSQQGGAVDSEIHSVRAEAAPFH